MSGLAFSLGLTVGCVLGVAAGGLVVWLWLERMRADAKEQLDYVRRWEEAGLQPARQWVRQAAYTEPEWTPDLSGISRTERLHRWLSRPELDWALGWTARLRHAAEPVLEPRLRLPIEAGPGRHRAALSGGVPAYTPGDFTLDLREYGLDVRTYQEVS